MREESERPSVLPDLPIQYKTDDLHCLDILRLLRPDPDYPDSRPSRRMAWIARKAGIELEICRRCVERLMLRGAVETHKGGRRSHVHGGMEYRLSLMGVNEVAG